MDISTRTAGLCVFDAEKEQILQMTYIPLGNQEGLYAKTQEFKRRMLELMDSLHEEVAMFCIEEALLGFGGGSSVHTRTLLCQFNALCQYVLQEEFDLPIKIINVNTVRAKLRKKFGWAIKGRNQKQIVFDLFCANKFWSDFELKPRAKTPIDEAKDMVDAFAVAVAATTN